VEGHVLVGATFGAQRGGFESGGRGGFESGGRVVVDVVEGQRLEVGKDLVALDDGGLAHRALGLILCEKVGHEAVGVDGRVLASAPRLENHAGFTVQGVKAYKASVAFAVGLLIGVAFAVGLLVAGVAVTDALLAFVSRLHIHEVDGEQALLTGEHLFHLIEGVDLDETGHVVERRGGVRVDGDGSRGGRALEVFLVVDLEAVGTNGYAVDPGIFRVVVSRVVASRVVTCREGVPVATALGEYKSKQKITKQARTLASCGTEQALAGQG
jgi:hypothetical protein